MRDIFFDSVVLDRLKYEIKGLRCTTEREKVVREGVSITMVEPQLPCLWQLSFVAALGPRHP
jgi:diacylglycerol kinase